MSISAGRDSVTEIKLLDEVTFRGRNGFTYTGFIVALNGSTEIFPDGSALVKHSDTLYNRDRRGPDVPSRLGTIEVMLSICIRRLPSCWQMDACVEVKHVMYCVANSALYELLLYGARYLARNDVACVD